METREGPQTSTAVSCFVVPYNPTVCEPTMCCFRMDLTSSGTSRMPSQPVLEASSILNLLDPFRETSANYR